MILNNGKFTFAHYANKNKDLIKTVWYDNDTKTGQEITIKTDLTNDMYKKLLETFTVDEITTMTDQKTSIEEQNFHSLIKNMAIKHGLVYDPKTKNPQEVLNLDSIFNFKNDTVDNDFLFELKIKIFDLPQVSSSTNNELKKKLRESDTPLQALYIAGKFLYE